MPPVFQYPGEKHADVHFFAYLHAIFIFVRQTYIFRTNICKLLFTKQMYRVMMWTVDEGGRAHEN